MPEYLRTLIRGHAGEVSIDRQQLPDVAAAIADARPKVCESKPSAVEFSLLVLAIAAVILLVFFAFGHFIAGP